MRTIETAAKSVLRALQSWRAVDRMLRRLGGSDRDLTAAINAVRVAIGTITALRQRVEREVEEWELDLEKRRPGIKDFKVQSGGFANLDGPVVLRHGFGSIALLEALSLRGRDELVLLAVYEDGSTPVESWTPWIEGQRSAEELSAELDADAAKM